MATSIQSPALIPAPSATSPWFDYEHYMAKKLIQVQTTLKDPSFTMEQVVQAFSDSGLGGEAGAEQHFLLYGQFEGVSPNPLFSATEYIRAKAAQHFKVDNPLLVTDLQAATIKSAFSEAGVSAWEHYMTYGTKEGINPSNEFNTTAYMEAKVAALNKPGAEKVWTLDEVYAVFQASGMSALHHFMTYGGKGANEVAEAYTPGVVPEAFKVAEENKVAPEGSGSGGGGNIVALTSEIDLLTGTDGNDVFVANAATGQGADRIDGGKGEDTYHFTGTNAGGGQAFVYPELKNIKKVVIEDNNSSVVNMTRVEGLTSVEMNRHDLATADVTVTLKNQHLTLNDAIVSKTGGDTLTIDSEADTVLNMTIGNLGKTTSGKTTLDIAGETFTDANLLLNGKDAVFALANTGAKLTTLNLTGNSKMVIENTSAELKTVDATEVTGSLDFTHTTANALTFTGSIGNDRLNLGTGFDASDVIDFGEGTEDTLALDVSTVTKEGAALINAVKGLDVLEFNGSALAAGTGLAVNTELLSTKVFKISSDITGTADAAVFSNMRGDGEEKIVLASSLTGASNGDGLEVSVKDGGTNTDAISFEVRDAVAVVMGNGTGAGINADGFEILNIMVEKDLTSSGGTVDTIVGTHAQITITGEGDVNLGMVATKAGVAVTENNTTITATDLDGMLTVSTSAGKDTISVGDGGSLLSGGKNGDIFTLGKGEDVLTYVAGDSGALDGSNFITSSIDMVKGFTAGANGDIIKGLSAEYIKLDALTLSTIASSENLLIATNAALTAAADNKWTAFTYDNTTYAVFDTDDTFDAAAGVIVNLSGVELKDLSADNFEA